MNFPVLIESFATPNRFFLVPTVDDFPKGKRFTIIDIDDPTERDVLVLSKYCHQSDDIPF